jgi:hypothetical protein
MRLEPAATNLLTYSEAFSNAAWDKLAVTATDKAVAAPAYGSDAPTYPTVPDHDLASSITNATSNTHRLRQAVSLTSGTTYTFSVYAAADQVPSIYLQARNISTDTTGGCAFNVSTGAILDAPSTVDFSVTPRIQIAQSEASSKFYRASITFEADGTGNFYLEIYGVDSSTTVVGTTIYTEAGTHFHLWGAQLEAGPIATSYIPTTSASATREADNLYYSGTDNIDPDMGTIYTEYRGLPLVDMDGNHTDGYLVWAGNSSADSNYISIYGNTSNDYAAALTNSTTLQFTSTKSNDFGQNTTTSTAKLKYRANDFQFESPSGTEDSSMDTSGSTPSSIDTIFIGQTRSTTKQPAGIIRRVKISDRNNG